MYNPRFYQSSIFMSCISAFLFCLVTGLFQARVSDPVKTSLPLQNLQATSGSHLLRLHAPKHYRTDVTNKTMSTPPAAKRRRVDSLGIHKPFVSPLKRNTPTTTTSTPAPSRTQPPSTPYTPLRSSNLKSSTLLHRNASHDPYDPEIVQAQQEIKALEARIRVLRSQNGILAQAAQITAPAASCSQPSHSSSRPSSQSSSQPSSQQQPRLIRLSQKWLKASQLAAEEVFYSFSQNIKDNGGYNAFLSQQKQHSTAFFNDEQPVVDETNEENWRDEEGDELTERGKRQRRGMIEENASKQQHERESDEGDEDKDEAEEEEEQELSLGVMLKVLNIDHEVIGWDNKTLAWE